MMTAEGRKTTTTAVADQIKEAARRLAALCRH